MATQGRLRPYSVALRRHAVMLQCMRQNSANSGRSPHEKTYICTSATRPAPVVRQPVDDGKLRNSGSMRMPSAMSTFRLRTRSNPKAVMNPTVSAPAVMRYL